MQSPTRQRDARNDESAAAVVDYDALAAVRRRGGCGRLPGRGSRAAASRGRLAGGHQLLRRDQARRVRRQRRRRSAVFRHRLVASAAVVVTVATAGK